MTITKKILDTLSSPEFQTIIIHRHQNPDPDALGSQGGLQRILQYAFPEKQIYAVGEETNSLQFMHRMDSISDEAYEGALVVVLDTGGTERISDQRYRKGKTVIKIDHHPNVEPYGHLVWVDTTFSSASEMIYYLVTKSAGKLSIQADSARLLFSGIAGDTGRFLHNNTKPSTFMAAADLIQKDFSPQEFYQNLYQEPLNVVRFKGYVLQNFKISEHGVASMHITKDMLKNFGIERIEASNLVYVLGDIESIKIWTFMVEYEEQIRVRIRSKGPSIGEVAQKYNGGGHPLASGATVYSNEEAEALISDLDKLL